MSRPHYDWWCNATRMIRNYPARKAEHDELTAQNVTANMSGMPGGGGGASRTTELSALREMAPAKQREYDAVHKALEITEMLPNGNERVQLIRCIYWGGKYRPIHSVVGSLYISESTGWRWHGAFVKLVGELFGYIV